MRASLTFPVGEQYWRFALNLPVDNGISLKKMMMDRMSLGPPQAIAIDRATGAAEVLSAAEVVPFGWWDQNRSEFIKDEQEMNRRAACGAQIKPLFLLPEGA